MREALTRGDGPTESSGGAPGEVASGCALAPADRTGLVVLRGPGRLPHTQEQPGDDEIVACYKVSTGAPVWKHRDPVRFWESNGGAGPRATPTLSHGRVYTFGATGMLNALDTGNGAVVWSRNAASDTHRKVPDWGFASSPLVVDDIVIVAVSGTLAAYDLATGKPRWVGPQHGGTYSSPQLFTFDGVAQILLLNPRRDQRRAG